MGKKDNIPRGACCDLHTHSIYSDGTCSPGQLICLAEEIGLGAVALCDHNTVAGLPEFLKAGENSSVEAVAGVEFSTQYNGGELHILALFLKPEHFSDVTRITHEMMHRKERSNRDLVEKLLHAGIRLDYEGIRSATPNGQVNRAVIGAEMLRLGYVSSISEAFQRWLARDCGFYQPPERLDTLETIRYISSIGAAPVLAHPFLNLDECRLRKFLPVAMAGGLLAMETLYPQFTPEQSDLACRIAQEYGLLSSGGSDFHGSIKPEIQLGRGDGDLYVPMEMLERIRCTLHE